MLFATDRGGARHRERAHQKHERQRHDEQRNETQRPRHQRHGPKRRAAVLRDQPPQRRHRREREPTTIGFVAETPNQRAATGPTARNRRVQQEPGECRDRQASEFHAQGMVQAPPGRNPRCALSMLANLRGMRLIQCSLSEHGGAIFRVF